MRESSNNYQHSVSANRPVDPSTAAVPRSLDPIAHAVGCAYFVAGAAARDLILVNVYGRAPGRATYDIDFGIAVESWERFANLRERLIATGEFAEERRALQRLIHTDRTTGSPTPVDLIPFRGVATAEGTIAWPPSRDIVMNVASFEEALESSVPIEIDDSLTVRVASIPGLTLLKLTAWADRGRETNKDAVDLYQLLTTYADAGNIDRIYDQESVLLEAVDFNMELAGAELLGRDVANIGSSQVLDQVGSLLTSEPDRGRLVSQMAHTRYAEITIVDRMVSAFCRGLVRAK